MTTTYTQLEQQRMTIARLRRENAALAAELARLRALAPYDAAHWRARCEVLEAEARLLRAANRGWAERGSK